mmetsp:Transcript_43957/g.44623  ORF Transcript_43957/g.44623 Transcript_43957/m.44623 type:complete len:84 (-) Transcript_43957:561-812(-)
MFLHTYVEVESHLFTRIDGHILNRLKYYKYLLSQLQLDGMKNMYRQQRLVMRDGMVNSHTKIIQTSEQNKEKDSSINSRFLWL